MNEIEMENLLYWMLRDKDIAPWAFCVKPFDESDVVTDSRGLVVRCTDGAEFHVTITESP